MWSCLKTFGKQKFWDLDLCQVSVEKDEPKVMTRFLGSMTEWRVVTKESTGCWGKREIEIKSGIYFVYHMLVL